MTPLKSSPRLLSFCLARTCFATGLSFVKWVLHVDDWRYSQRQLSRVICHYCLFFKLGKYQNCVLF